MLTPRQRAADALDQGRFDARGIDLAAAYGLASRNELLRELAEAEPPRQRHALAKLHREMMPAPAFTNFGVGGAPASAVAVPGAIAPAALARHAPLLVRPGFVRAASGHA
jgi:hypothetical protein